MEVHETDDSNVGYLLDPHAKSLIREQDLTESDQVTHEKKKISKNDNYTNDCKGNN